MHVIPFFDGSLAFSYKLEGIRRGSRLFFADAVSPDEFGDLNRFAFQWKYISGMGDATKGIHEFMWPACLYREEPTELAALIVRAFRLWRSFAADPVLTRDEYRRTIYHLDETIKTMLRSFVALRDLPGTNAAIKAFVDQILPSEADRMDDCNIRNVWGFWFQVLFVLSTLGKVDEYAERIAFTKRELVRRKYFENFVAEAEYPDYAPMKRLFKMSSWN